MDKKKEESLHLLPPPHVIILPFPLQGHIKPMLNLAKLLCLSNFEVTFFISHHHLHHHHHHYYFPSLSFESISDGLPPDHPRTGPESSKMLLSVKSAAKVEFKEKMTSIMRRRREQGLPPPACVIADGLMSAGVEVGEEVGVPVVSFHTHGAYCLWLYFHLIKLIELGEVPTGSMEMDKPISSIAGLDRDFRRRDLPGICRCEEPTDPFLQFFIAEAFSMRRASALILNTFHQLESPVLSKLASLFPKLYALGPLHALLASTTAVNDTHQLLSPMSSNGVLWEEERSCMSWLDSQVQKSVVYVSFGSLVVISRAQMVEFWHGLVNSEKHFLWVLRKDLIFEEEEGINGEVPLELEVATRERGCIVKWAPQEEVLAHPAIGGFLTHSGWNSTLESIFAGVPMICWPLIADQQVNSWCVERLWKVGLDMKDVCDRLVVEKMVRDLIDHEEKKRDEIRESTIELARMARESVKEGRSSYLDLEKLIEDIKAMSLAS